MPPDTAATAASRRAAPPRPGLPPGPRAPALVQTIAAVRRPLAFIRDCARRFGDAFTIRLTAGDTFAVFSHPDAIRAIFQADETALEAGGGNEILRPYLGDRSLFLLNGELHRRHRRLLMPAFHGDRMRAYGGLIREVTERVADRFPEGRAFAFEAAAREIAFEIIVRAVFGVSAGARGAALRGHLAALLETLSANISSWRRALVRLLHRDLGPWSPGGRLRARTAAIDALVREEIASRAGAAPGDDILSLLLAARDDTGAPLSTEEVRDELLTLLVAGHETTTSALAWAMHWIHAKGGVRDRLRAEIDAGGRDYLDAVVKETLRIRPVVPIVARRVRTPVEVGGFLLPAGVYVAPCIFLAHQREDVYPDPDRFRPERFLERRFTPFEYLPFGGGARRCIGAAFATYEIEVVLATLLARHDFALAGPPAVEVARRGVTLAPAGGARVTATRRRASA